MAADGPFADRAQAGQRLVGALPPLKGDLVVLGLARGGVPVAAQVAAALGAPLDVLVVRKVGHPRQREYALGAVSEDGVSLPSDLPADLVDPQMEQARAQAQSLRGGRPRVELAGRTVVVVDDGLATGRSMAAALESVAGHQPARVVMAVPVASGPGLRELAQRWETVAAIVVEPPGFMAVGQFYADFSQVEDEAVAEFLGGGES
jgi:predicted phosphoribosyltransferase